MQNCDKGEKDVNDIFDDILFSEEKLIEKGYSEGFKKGSAEGNPEGYHLGYHRGAELGAEIGYYSGIVNSYLKEPKYQSPNEKIVKLLNNLKELLENFPDHNSEDVDILELSNQIRAKFKMLCALLKVDLSYPETDKLSF